MVEVYGEHDLVRVHPKTFGVRFIVGGEDKLRFNVSRGVKKSKIWDEIRFIK